MKRFSDLGISQSEDRKIFNCSQVSISDVFNHPVMELPEGWFAEIEALT